MTLMQFDAYEQIRAAPVLGPLTFSLFVLIVVFVYMSMFLLIINDSFQEYIYSFIIDRLLFC